MLFGILIAAIGIYDLAQLQWNSFCGLLQNSSFAVGMTVKIAHVSMAVDQFVAVTQPLRRYQLMERTLPWFLFATFAVWVLQTTFGLITSALNLQTVAESLVGRENSSVMFPGCRYETGITKTMLLSIEVETAISSFVTASLFIYTGVVGHRNKSRLMGRMNQRWAEDSSRHDHQRFFENYKAFKSICAVLSLTLVLDVVFTVIRFIARWYPIPTTSGFLHMVRLLAFIIEGWAYGLLNAKMRAAYKKSLCGRSRAIDPMPVGAVAAGQRQNRQETAAQHPRGLEQVDQDPKGLEEVVQDHRGFKEVVQDPRGSEDVTQRQEETGNAAESQRGSESRVHPPQEMSSGAESQQGQRSVVPAAIFFVPVDMPAIE